MQEADLSISIKLTEKALLIKVARYNYVRDCDWRKFAVEEI
jgi:hypothetical protein